MDAPQTRDMILIFIRKSILKVKYLQNQSSNSMLLSCWPSISGLKQSDVIFWHFLPPGSFFCSQFFCFFSPLPPLCGINLPPTINYCHLLSLPRNNYLKSVFFSDARRRKLLFVTLLPPNLSRRHKNLSRRHKFLVKQFPTPPPPNLKATAPGALL